MSVWGGWDNAVPTAIVSPQDFVPTSQDQLQWPKWGQHYETRGRSGEAPNLRPGIELLELYKDWYAAPNTEARTKVWKQILEIHAEQVFTIGTVSAIPQPVVVNRRLHNLPKEGTYSWYPGSFFGSYHLDHVWLEPKDGSAQ